MMQGVERRQSLHPVGVEKCGLLRLRFFYDQQVSSLRGGSHPQNMGAGRGDSEDHVSSPSSRARATAWVRLWTFSLP